MQQKLSIIDYYPNKDHWDLFNSFLYLLIGIIIIMILYNYYILSMRVYNVNNGNSDNSLISQDNFTVNSAIDNISQYTSDGEMSNKLKQYYDQYNLIKQEILLKMNKNTNNNTNNNTDKNTNINMNTADKNTNMNMNMNTDKKIKLHIYHMPGCYHCKQIMDDKPNGELSIFKKLVSFFRDKSVEIKEYQLGRDKEAERYRSFPTIIFMDGNKTEEYNGQRDLNSLIKLIKDKM